MIIAWLAISILLTIILLAVGVLNTVGAVLTSFVLCFLAQLLVWAIVGITATLFVDIHKDNKKDSPFFRFYANGIIDILMCVLRIRVKVSGFEQVPDGKFLLISNHRSAFDPILQMGVFRKYRLSFVSKQENLKMPIIGKIMHRCSCVSLDRENAKQAIKAISQAAEIIQTGDATIGIYPEGTRNKEDGLLPFKPGAFKIAQKADCPIVVAVIENSEFVMKNAPFKKTDVSLRILAVLPPKFVHEHTTVQLSETVYDMMLDALNMPQSV